ncbi:unnamed protein product [Rhizophagus irregularis]|uniref:Uncharacterized protein n=1 Tax=Rhizophagus irregularis TaxID=588596 RepID=A0A915Z4X3_9GLOM|nr:unnamed protein product [Rhizophagus irregularis]
MKKQKEQMELSLYYHAVKIELEVLHSKKIILDESNQYINNLFDCPQVQISLFLEDTSLIFEVWEVVYLTSQKTSHFVCLLNNGTFLFWRTLDLERKVIVDVIENNNEDTYRELCEVFLSIQKKLQPRIVVDNSNGSISINSNNNGESDNIINIQNPIERRSKGCPKSNKRMKNTLELSNTKTQYTCKLYNFDSAEVCGW